MLNIQISKKAKKFLEKLPSKHKNQIAIKIQELRKHSHSHDSIQLKGSEWFRVDVGEYRIIYNVFESENLLTIPLVGKRNDGDVYKRLTRLD